MEVLEQRCTELSAKDNTTKEAWLELKVAAETLVHASKKQAGKTLVELANEAAAERDREAKHLRLQSAVEVISAPNGLTPASLKDLETSWAEAPETVSDELEYALGELDGCLLDQACAHLGGGVSHATAKESQEFVERVCTLAMQVTAVPCLSLPHLDRAVPPPCPKKKQFPKRFSHDIFDSVRVALLSGSGSAKRPCDSSCGVDSEAKHPSLFQMHAKRVRASHKAKEPIILSSHLKHMATYLSSGPGSHNFEDNLCKGGKGYRRFMFVHIKHSTVFICCRASRIDADDLLIFAAVYW